MPKYREYPVYSKLSNDNKEKFYSFLLTVNPENGIPVNLSGRGFYSGDEVVELIRNLHVGNFGELTLKIWSEEGEEDEELDD